MIHKIVIRNSNLDMKPMTLTNPETSGFIVMDIQGLGPGKTNVNIRENAFISGSIFNSAQTPSRNIILTLRFLPMGLSTGDPGPKTIENARLNTYRYFNTESIIRFYITTDAGTFYIDGYVESNEPTIFSRDEGTVISIICPDPFFRNTLGGTKEGETVGVISGFNFPFSNEGYANTISFGEQFFQSENIEIVLDSTISVGPEFKIMADGGAVVNPQLVFRSAANPEVSEFLRFVFTENLPQLEDGDWLEITCERQNKTVKRWKSSTQTYINYIGAVTLDSSWPLLRPGSNIFSYSATSGAGYIRFTWKYALKYTGV